ncbi:unnamed protein product [Peniophora sp. CBMAI 1063]|nr:unnamed protein product [Peniophora sp. CBMAI 1063]
MNNSSPTSGARYATYTPRHRTAATTSTTLQAGVTVPPQHQQGATSKLQLMNLKAYAQSVGLETGSVGWEMLEKLTADHEHGLEWTEIWNALTAGKATLLLPLEQAHNVQITTDFIKDHIALCDNTRQNTMSIVTMSGLRGKLVDQTLTLRSTLQPGSKMHAGLLLPTSRTNVLASLPPLPQIFSSPLSQAYPTYSLPSHTQTLPLPLHAIPKPPLPPRPGARPSSAQGTSSRLTSSFASLFGKQTPTASPASPASSTATLEEHPAEVAAFTIDRRIVMKDVSLQINKALKAEMHEALSSAGAPTWLIDKVDEFSTGLYPFVKNQGPTPRRGKGLNISPFVIDPPQETPDELSKQFQDFYAGLEADLLSSGRGSTSAGSGGSHTPEGTGEEEKEKEKTSKKGSKELSEDAVREILESVERVMCSLFYDRLYMQPKADDASHDEALSSRVAALNLMDISLEHLGVDVGQSTEEVEVVLKSCGETLSQLEQSACRCPADKAAILVAAHKILVDGLSRLPPIRLKTEAELKDQPAPTPTASSFSSSTAAQSAADGLKVETHADLTTEHVATPPIVVSPSDEHEVNPLSEKIVDAALSSIPPSETDTTLVPDRTESPQLVISRPHTPTPVSGDLILPLMIYSVVKSNPPHFVSHLLFTQRFRNERLGGEEAYCLVNMLAVADFLENVDLAVLGLGGNTDVKSVADLSPIPVARAGVMAAEPAEGVPARLRRGVGEQVDAIAGSANKVLAGVVDSSFGVLRSLLPGQTPGGETSAAGAEGAEQYTARAGFGLLRRESGFSIASLAASLPGRDRARSFGSLAAPRMNDEGGQQLVEVSSRPGSVHSAYLSDEAASDSDEEESGEEDEDEEESDGRDDGRSIKSFESMMKKGRKKKDTVSSRKSLSDRLASMPGLGRLQAGSVGAAASSSISPPASRRSSLLFPAAQPAAQPNRFDTPMSSRAPSPSLRIAPPNARFLECAEDDLRVGEVKELLREYRRVVEALRMVGGFSDEQ